MGATESSILGCPVRKSAKESTVPAKTISGKSLKDPPIKAVRAAPKRTTKQFEAQSRDAEEFSPQDRQPPVGKESLRVDPNEPEWAQFLAKKVAEKHAKAEPPLQPKGRNNGVVESKPAQAQGIAMNVNTSEYLKLLKAGDQKQSADKQRKDYPWNTEKNRDGGVGPPPGLPDGNAMASLKNDLAGALDSIIRSQQKLSAASPNKKPTALKKVIMQERADRGVKEDPLMRIAQMLESGQGGTSPEEEEEPASTTARDDLLVERENRDEDLAELAYWSEDDMAPRAIHRASAHKVGNRPLDNRTIRDYVTQEVGPDLDKQVAILLLHLRRLNDRHRTFDPEAPGKRRFVVGIKEVSRAVRHGRVKCIIVAPDIEEVGSAGGLDDRVRDILRVSYQQDLPVIFALSRVRIGRAIGKSLRMSVVAILEVAGTQALYDDVLELAYSKRLSFLSKIPKQGAQTGGTQCKAVQNRGSGRNNSGAQSNQRRK